VSDQLAVRDGAEDEVESALSRLTPTQRERLLKRVAGATLAEIAKAEGRSIAAVDESLKSPAVRQATTILGRSLEMQNSKTGEVSDILKVLLGNALSIALNATRPVVVSDGNGGSVVKQVVDYKTRLDASTRLLALVDPPVPEPPAPVAASPAARPTVELEQTQMTKRRVRVS
jgi:hypothetical protein